MIGVKPALAKPERGAQQLDYRPLANDWVRLAPLAAPHRADLRVALGDGSALRYSPSKQFHGGGFDAWFD